MKLEDLPESLRKRYAAGGGTVGGTTDGNATKLVEVGPAKGLSGPIFARYATLMNYSGGQLLFGREHQLGSFALSPGIGYTFDYVDVHRIVIQDNGTPVVWNIDYTGP